MKTEQFILSEISKINDRIGAIIRHYQVAGLNERGCVKYKEAVDSLRDAVNHLKIASVNTVSHRTVKEEGII